MPGHIHAGAADDEIRQFLQQIGTPYTFALAAAPEGITVTGSWHKLTLGEMTLPAFTITGAARVKVDRAPLGVENIRRG